MPKKFTGDLSKYKPEYLDCRENHNWAWVTDWKLTRGPGGKLLEFSRLKKCTRCNAFVDRKYDGQTGRSLGKNRYNYPDGFLASRENPIDAGGARLEQLRRDGLIE